MAGTGEERTGRGGEVGEGRSKVPINLDGAVRVQGKAHGAPGRAVSDWGATQEKYRKLTPEPRLRAPSAEEGLTGPSSCRCPTPRWLHLSFRGC